MMIAEREAIKVNDIYTSSDANEIAKGGFRSRILFADRCTHLIFVTNLSSTSS